MYILYFNHGYIDLLWQANADNLYIIILGLDYFKEYKFIHIFCFVLWVFVCLFFLIQTMSLISDRSFGWMVFFCFCFYRTEVGILHIDTNADICKKEKKKENYKEFFLLTG